MHTCPHIHIGVSDEIHNQRIRPNILITEFGTLLCPNVTCYKELIKRNYQSTRLDTDNFRRVPVRHYTENRFFSSNIGMGNLIIRKALLRICQIALQIFIGNLAQFLRCNRSYLENIQFIVVGDSELDI